MEGFILTNKKGVALVIALIMLLILTFIGISAISTTTFETHIAGNERAGTDAFYAAEAIFQVSVNQLPDTTPITRPIGENSRGWTGSPQAKGPLTTLGLFSKEGFDSSWSFTRYQINATGESFGTIKEVEAQVRFGPFPAGTQY
ncbi:MAG: pilus assembly PilX family protein [Thermodesulfobacteriota bacterium]